MVGLRVHELFEEQVRQHPERTAVVAGHERLDFAELNRRANLVAHALGRAGVGRGDLVGVCLERAGWLVPALLGVLKSGAAYVGLDPAYPEERLRLVAQDAGLARVLLSPATAGWRSDLLTAAGAPAITLDGPDFGTGGGGLSDVNPAVPGAPGDAAYVIYTSGSTGRPKGVVVEHRSLVNLIQQTADLYSAEERSGMLAAASVCFDASVLELFPTLAHGGTLVLADTLLALHTLPARAEVTTIFGVPSALMELLRDPLPAGVHTVMTGGEAVTAALVERTHAQPGVRRLLNLYGPTEATIYCTAVELPRGHTGEVPIGRAVAGARLSVRDRSGVEVRDGEEGELWVAGPVLSRGYLNRPELTAAQFVYGADGVRHYRTGDLARRNGEEFYCLGRIDDQVKVRGFRIELGEVQAALAAHPEVGQAVVLADGELGARRLVGYVERAGQVSEQDLRSWLAERLPEYMVPSRIAVLDRLPIAPNGKLDRAALPEFGVASAYEPPVTPTEEVVAAVVQDVLGLGEPVGRHDRFVDLGGHSLAAARVCAEVGRRLGVTVPLATFLGAPSAAGLAARLAGPSSGPELVRHADRDYFPLTATQRELWTLKELDPTGLATTVAVRLRCHGLVDANGVRRALDGLVRRHQVLRTRFLRQDGDPVSMVGEATPVPLVEHDIRNLPEWAREDLVLAAARHSFDLAAAAPLLRASLLWTADGVAELVVTADHIAFDGASIGPLMTELATELSGAPVDEPPLQIGDLALYEQEIQRLPGRVEQALEFWRSELDGVSVPDDLGARPEPGRSAYRGERVGRRLGADVIETLRKVTASCEVTPFAAYLAALAVLVAAQGGSSDTVVGVATARRDLPGVGGLVGPLVTVLPVGVDLTDDPSFASLARRVAASTVRALTQVDVPPSDVLPGGVSRLAGAMFTPVMLSVQPSDVPMAVEHGRVRIEYVSDVHAGGAQSDLAVFVTEGVDGVQLQLQYDVSRFGADDAGRMLDRLVALLAAGLSTPDVRVSRLELVSDEERAALLAAGSGSGLAADRPNTVVASILTQAAARPGAVAVSGRDAELSYAELADRSARMAAALVAAGVGPGSRVGVCVPRDHLMPAALLAVMRAGAAYVPLDPEYPPARLDWMVADAGVQVMASRGTALAAAHRIAGVRTVDLDDTAGDTAAGGAAAPAAGLPDVHSDDLAYLLYTSGSTGQPKGVEVTHANLAAHTAGLEHDPGLSSTDRMMALAALTFDATGIEIWSPLAVGARCVVVERDCVLDGHALSARLDAVAPTVAFLPPALLRMLLAAGWTGDPRLRVWCGGEAVDAALVRSVLPRVDGFWNVYGPTEATTLSTAHRVSDEDLDTGRSIPIGHPLPGERAYVVDPFGRLVPVGVTGELWLGGHGVAQGYRGRAELTDAAFVPDPYDPGGRCYRTGDLVRWTDRYVLEFVGRRDHQVKVRGQRLELGEIEAALHDHHDVTQAVVTVSGEGPAASLVGYVTPSTVDVGKLEAFLRDRLPDYMVPRRWMPLSELPMTASGKVDRRALPEPSALLRQGEPPRTATEQFVAAVWAEVTGATEISRDDDFFALGGNSFAATRVTGRVRAALDCEVPVQVLFERPLLADFAAEVERLALDALASQSGELA